MRKYRVINKQPIVDFIVSAIECSGSKVLELADAGTAPFEFRILTPADRELHLICYAFLANEYRQKGRPPGEHRFQVKYGSEFDTYHRIFIADREDVVTLMFGVHLDEQIIIAVDPAMHEWTRFSRSIEFKSSDVALATSAGWHGWERDRSDVRRRRPAPNEDQRTEVLLGIRPDRFMDLVALEQFAHRLDPGERLRLIDEIGDGKRLPDACDLHELEAEFGLPAREILDLAAGAFRLLAALRGRVAEYHLGRHLESSGGIDRVVELDADGKPDFEVYRGGSLYRVECKNVLRRLTASGHPRVDFQKTRASRGNPCSRYYKASQFEVLAACLHPVSQRWEFQFCLTNELNDHPRCVGHLSPSVIVEGHHWSASINEVLQRA